MKADLPLPKQEENNMSKLTMTALGLSLMVGSAFAAAPQASPATPATKSTAKKVKVAKKNVKKTAATADKTAPAATK
jgi:hypothetical protein